MMCGGADNAPLTTFEDGVVVKFIDGEPFCAIRLRLCNHCAVISLQIILKFTLRAVRFLCPINDDVQKRNCQAFFLLFCLLFMNNSIFDKCLITFLLKNLGPPPPPFYKWIHADVYEVLCCDDLTKKKVCKFFACDVTILMRVS